MCLKKYAGTPNDHVTTFMIQIWWDNCHTLQWWQIQIEINQRRSLHTFCRKQDSVQVIVP